VTVAMFDDPGNPRHPATWFTMNAPFAYLSATLDLQAKALTITKDQPLNVRYGLALWDGEVPPADIQRLFQTWIQLK
jgi:hypothetical protein